mmetsp:Transcript_15733/g.28268  ORF Transcript_15733/g.28268 Transcript_15733/m.28268 type:complete len:246 (-) Transcript_15733:1177-1914(-)
MPIRDLNHIRPIRVLPTFAIVRVLSSIEVGSMKLDVHVVILSYFEKRRREIVFHSRIVLHNVASPSPQTKIVNGTALSLAGRILHSKRVRAILESTASLMSVDSQSQLKALTLTHIFLKEVHVRPVLQRYGGGGQCGVAGGSDARRRRGAVRVAIGTVGGGCDVRAVVRGIVTHSNSVGFSERVRVVVVSRHVVAHAQNALLAGRLLRDLPLVKRCFRLSLLWNFSILVDLECISQVVISTERMV